MENAQQMYDEAHSHLNTAYEYYKKCSSTNTSNEADSILLQACIFQYEMCVEFRAFMTNKPLNFALKVSLKGLVHKLYEYNLLSSNLLRRLIVFAHTSGIQVSDQDFKAERRKYKAHFRKLNKWSSIRNIATGHYDKNTISQIEALNEIKKEEVFSVAIAFFASNIAFLKMLNTVRSNSLL